MLEFFIPSAPTMDTSPSNIESPLTTRHKRDSLARRPLRQLIHKPKPPTEQQPHPIQEAPTPGGQFATSSPRSEDGEDASQDGPDLTPGLSLIEQEDGGSQGKAARGSRTNDASKASRRTISFSAEDSEEEEEDQPSARITNRSHQDRAVGTTPGRFNGTTGAFGSRYSQRRFYK